jgi:hypothetical protein
MSNQKHLCHHCSSTDHKCNGHHGHRISPEEYLDKIEQAVKKIPQKRTRERVDRLILLTSGIAAEAAEHKDFTMLKIVEVYLTLRLAEELRYSIDPGEAELLFRNIAKTVGSVLTAKYGLEGLTKIEFVNNQGPGSASLIFVTCYGIGKVLADYFTLQSRGLELAEPAAKEKFKTAKAEAFRLI